MIPIFLYNSFLQGPAIGGLGNMIESILFLDLLFFFYHVYNILDFIFNMLFRIVRTSYYTLKPPSSCLSVSQVTDVLCRPLHLLIRKR